MRACACVRYVAYHYSATLSDRVCVTQGSLMHGEPATHDEVLRCVCSFVIVKYCHISEYEHCNYLLCIFKVGVCVLCAYVDFEVFTVSNIVLTSEQPSSTEALLTTLCRHGAFAPSSEPGQFLSLHHRRNI